MADHLEIIKNAVINGKPHSEIKRPWFERPSTRGLILQWIINEALIPAMDVVGKEFWNRPYLRAGNARFCRDDEARPGRGQTAHVAGGESGDLAARL